MKQTKFYSPTLSTKEIILFFRQLSTLTSAGIPLLQSLSAIEKGCSKSMLPIIKNSHLLLEQGNSLTQTLKRYPTIFNEFYCGLIEVGELSGKLDHVLTCIVLHQEKITLFKTKLKNSMIYPTCVLVASSLLTVFLLVFIVPTFQTLYSDLKLTLPFSTKIILSLSKSITNQGCIFIFTLLFLTIVLKMIYVRYSTVKKHIISFFSFFFLTFPFLRQLYRTKLLTHFLTALYITQAAGVPIVQALESISGSFSNPFFLKTIQTLKTHLKQGSSLTQAMHKSKFFTPLVTQMIHVGEESGTLDLMLGKLVELYELEFSSTLTRIATLIEPLMMIFLGIVIGGMVIALYLPLFNLGL